MQESELDITQYQAEIAQIKSKWNTAFSEKEEWAAKKKQISSQISEVIREVKRFKAQRDALNKKIKELKVERDGKNKVTQELIGSVKGLNDQKQVVLKEHRIEGDPAFLKKEIDKLNHKLETEVVNFDSEKKLMKQIKQLKKEYEKVKAVSGVIEQVHDFNTKIKDARKDAKKVHDEIQTIAEESEKCHTQVIELSKKVDELKISEEDAAKQFDEKKKFFSEIDSQLKSLLDKSTDIRRAADDQRERKKKNQKEKVMAQLEEKGKEVEEKIKKKGILTMGDILAFQAKAEKEEKQEQKNEQHK
jgi:uncharacterized coiled-coil DUF342 family protein